MQPLLEHTQQSQKQTNFICWWFLQVEIIFSYTGKLKTVDYKTFYDDIEVFQLRFNVPS